MVSMVTCIERRVRLQMKISYDWTVRSIKTNSENEEEMFFFFFKKEVLRLKSHNKICGCYYNLTVMWLSEKYCQGEKKWVILMPITDNSTLHRKPPELDIHQHSQVEKQASLLSGPHKNLQILMILFSLASWNLDSASHNPVNSAWWL